MLFSEMVAEQFCGPQERNLFFFVVRDSKKFGIDYNNSWFLFRILKQNK